MAAPFTYMGTKKRIAARVAEVIAGAQRGPLLDLFAGISAIGSAVSPSRNVWCNDVQHFAYALATAIFTSRTGPTLTDSIARDVALLAAKNKKALQGELFAFVREEEYVLERCAFRRGVALNERLVGFGRSERSYRLRRKHRRSTASRPYRLFSNTFAGGYVGIGQAIEIDSLRYAFDHLYLERSITVDQHRWFLIALCKALANVANTTGHFAQYLAIKERSYRRFLAQRRRNVYSEWRAALEEMSPEGNFRWRSGNRTFRKDANQLLKIVPALKAKPGVIYADPPYTRDHYSRYYHLLDTLILYDYPDPVGKGQYRSDRFASEFSMRTRVYSAFHDLVSSAAELGCDLIVNYPETGLLDDPRTSLLRLLKQYFRRAEVALRIPHQHSSLGASKGSEKSPVTELIFYAR